MNEITLLMQDTSFKRADNDQVVQGVTFIIDGHLKEIFDQIREKMPGVFQDYYEVIRSVLVEGLAAGKEFQFTMQNTSFERSDNKESVPGVTFIVDEELKELLDGIKAGNPDYTGPYSEILRDVVVKGLDIFYKRLH